MVCLADDQPFRVEILDNQEIARLLKVTETSVGVLLHRTRAQLQKDYRKNMRGEK